MESLYSTSWHRVADLRPRISAEVRFHRHVYRGQVSYVVQNPTTGRVHRLTPSAYAVVSQLDGARSVQSVWEASLDRLGDDAPTQDEAIQVLGLLHAADVLRCDVSPDTLALFRQLREREEKEASGRRKLLSFRLPLLDPDAFLSRWAEWTRPLFTRTGAAAWTAIVAIAGLLALRYAPELAAGSRSLLEPSTLIAMWFGYPIVKTLHELGHAFAVKRWGGEVHEIGIMFLVFMPVPYVDASAASVLEDKRRRMAVAGMGICVELLLASFALFVWLAAEPGAVRNAAWAIMVLCGVSSALFNGNPLLRFDGYFVLADWLEIPNLDGKARQYVGTLGKRWILGQHALPLPETAPGEPAWLVGYALAANLYRTLIACAIAMFLAGNFFELGLALAAITLFARVALPLLKHFAYVLGDPTVGERRGRAMAGSFGLVALLCIVLFAVPVPLRSRGEGVVWLPEHSRVRAGAEGFVSELLAEPHSQVRAGDALIRTRDPELEASVRGLEADVQRMEQGAHAISEDRVQAEIARSQLAETRAALARARERAGEVLIRSPLDGLFVLADGIDPTGRHVRQGDVVGYVVDRASDRAMARVVVRQDAVALLRENTEAVWVRLAHDLGSVRPARVSRQVPSATDQLPTAALGTAAGGPFAVDPADPEGTRTLETVFQFELALGGESAIYAAGERVHARFDHGTEPVAQRAYRSLRRLFLRQLGV